MSSPQSPKESSSHVGSRALPLDMGGLLREICEFGVVDAESSNDSESNRSIWAAWCWCVGGLF